MAGCPSILPLVVLELGALISNNTKTLSILWHRGKQEGPGKASVGFRSQTPLWSNGSGGSCTCATTVAGPGACGSGAWPLFRIFFFSSVHPCGLEFCLCPWACGSVSPVLPAKEAVSLSCVPVSDPALLRQPLTYSISVSSLPPWPPRQLVLHQGTGKACALPLCVYLSIRPSAGPSLCVGMH